MTPRWYLRRLASMDPAEIAGRLGDAARRRLWRFRPPEPPSRLQVADRLPAMPPGLLGGLASSVDDTAVKALLAEADELLAGRWTMFGRHRTDMTADVDYFLDFVGGTRAPDTGYALSINHRDEATVGNIKFVWEPARHHHLTLLAAAYALSGNAEYAKRIDTELRRYWAATPFLVGIHWTSGIEIGLRLIAWTWIRRLLDGWDGAPALFENNDVFVEQLGRHQQWLVSFDSHGSSANNHLIAEVSGQFIAASAFGLFERSDRWKDEAAAVLADQLDAQTFPDGLNRELAADYHGFVLDMALAAWAEATLTGHELADRLAEPIARALDALHGVVDRRGRPHRQGDSDDAHGLLVDPIGYDRWATLLRTAPLFAAPARWWAVTEPAGDVRSALLAGVARTRRETTVVVADDDRPRPSLFADAGLTVLRDTEPGRADELWCLIDHGPHGFLSTAAHAHADALALEIRHAGVEVVTDPGTYCYHGEPVWRDHFRSTVAHATVGLNGADQSDIGGPFLWTRKAAARLHAVSGLDDGPIATCTASHDGYDPIGFTHHRTVSLDRRQRAITITDRLDRAEVEEPLESCPVTLSFPMGPTVRAELLPDGATAGLTWPQQPAGTGRATVSLDSQLSWSIECGRERPPLGWYSAHFGTKQPSSLLIGRSTVAKPGAEYTTHVEFAERTRTRG